MSHVLKDVKITSTFGPLSVSVIENDSAQYIAFSIGQS